MKHFFILFRVLLVMCVSLSATFILAQETLNSNGKTYFVYPHKVSANSSWILDNGINRKNRQNVEYLYMAEVGSVNLIEESELEDNMNYFESELFEGNYMKMKSKMIHEIRKRTTLLACFHPFPSTMGK